MRKYLFNNKRIFVLETYDGSALFIAGYIVQILLQFVFSLILVTTKVSVEFTSSLPGVCILSTLNALAVFITPFIYSKIKGENLIKGVGFNKKISLLQVVIIAGISIATILAFAPLANWFVRFITWTGYHSDTATALQMTNWTSYLVGLLVLGILPAICEEFQYRGMIARAFGDTGVIFGIFLSAGLFAIMHGNPIQLVHQFGLGCICALVYFMTRSIWGPIMIHMINNIVALTGNFILHKTNNENYVQPEWAAIVSCILGLIILFGLIMALYVYTKKRRGDQNDNSPLFKGMKHNLDYMRFNKEERDAIEYEKQIRNDQLKECDTEEMQEVLQSALKEQKTKIDKRSRNSIFYAYAIALVVWIINTIMGYIK